MSAGTERALAALGGLAAKLPELEKQGFRGAFLARLGKGDGVTVTAPDDPTKGSNTKVWYYTDQRAPATAILMASASIPYADGAAYHGIEVMIGKAPRAFGWGDQDCVIGIGGASGASSGGGTNLIYNIINNYTINPASGQIRTLRVEPDPDDALSVAVQGPYIYPKNDATLQLLLFSTSSLDLSSHIPTGTNEHRIGVVYLDPLTNTLGFLAGAVGIASPAVPARDAFDADDIKAIDTSAVVPCAAVYLYKDQTEITVDDILNTNFEIRSIFYPPRLDVPGLSPGVYTNPASMRVNANGQVIEIVSGTPGGVGGGSPKTVKFKPSITQTLLPDTTTPIRLDSAVTNDDSAGAWSSPNFLFTAPITAMWRVRLHIVRLGSGTYSPPTILNFFMYDYPSGTPVPVLTVNYDNQVAGGTYEGTIYQTLTIGQVVSFKAEFLAGFPSESFIFDPDNTYVEIVSVPASGSFGTVAANLIFAGPTSGSAATPTFRAIVPADLVNIANTVTDEHTITTSTPFTSGEYALYTVPAGGQTLKYAEIHIQTGCNSGVTFTIGTDADDELIMNSAENYPRNGGAFYTKRQDIELTAGTVIKLYKSGTLSSGQFKVTLQLKG